ncbi:MAG: peptide deformylase [Ignavibacteriaceae bacterium]|nr:peptide deformylase [Ignavibacteriaceae bacterium]
MKLPILAYGHPKLRQKCEDITKNYPKLDNLIEDMWETLYAANGAGLAAPQVGRSIRLFVIDTIEEYDQSSTKGREKFVGDKGITEVFINPQIIERAGKVWSNTEGCLSIPNVWVDTERKMSLIIRYLNKDFEEREMFFSGATARAIFHEYDHIEGILFTDYSNNPVIKDKLERIARGDVKVNYKMLFHKAK